MPDNMRYAGFFYKTCDTCCNRMIAIHQYDYYTGWNNTDKQQMCTHYAYYFHRRIKISIMLHILCHWHCANSISSYGQIWQTSTSANNQSTNEAITNQQPFAYAQNNTRHAHIVIQQTQAVLIFFLFHYFFTESTMYTQQLFWNHTFTFMHWRIQASAPPFPRLKAGALSSGSSLYENGQKAFDFKGLHWGPCLWTPLGALTQAPVIDSSSTFAMVRLPLANPRSGPAFTDVTDNCIMAGVLSASSTFNRTYCHQWCASQLLLKNTRTDTMGEVKFRWVKSLRLNA